VSLVLFGQNLLETVGAAITTSPSTSAALIARLFDRDRGARWAGVSSAQHDITIDLLSAMGATHLSFVNHNLAVTVEVAGSSNGTFGAPFTTALVNSDPFMIVFPSLQTWRYFNVRIPAGAVTPGIGELSLGVPRTITSPTAKVSAKAIVGNVARDQSPAGYSWAAKLGAPRTRLDCAWNGIETAIDQVALEGAYADTAEGSKKLLVRDAFGVLRWMEITDAELAGEILNGRLNTARLTLEEAL